MYKTVVYIHLKGDSKNLENSIPSSHRVSINVLLNNITFSDFCCFQYISHCMSQLDIYLCFKKLPV